MFTQLTQQQKKTILLIGAALILIVFALFFSLRKPGDTTKATELVVWGVGDDRPTYEQIFERFGSPITYVKKDFSNYEQDLVNALASGQGPDVFMIHNSWLYKHRGKIIPAPADIVAPLAVQQKFPDVVTTDFVREGSVYSLPLSIDTLALFYDKDVFNGAFISEPPRTWSEFEELALRLTRRDAGGNIIQPGVAMGGSARLIDKATDVLEMLMLQNGSKMFGENVLGPFATLNSSVGGFDGSDPAVNALRFYLQFADPLSAFYVWDSSQHNSVDAFSYNSSARNKVAMTLNYHYRIPLLLSKNRNLRFGVSQVPQRDGAVGGQLGTYADYWGYAVSRASKNPQLAWQFIGFLTDAPQAKLYLAKTGKPPALRALISDYDNDPVLSVFARQILIAKSWVQPGHEDVSRVFAGIIDSVSQGLFSPQEAIGAAEQQINELFRKIK